VRVLGSPGLGSFLADHQVAVAFTTYAGGMVGVVEAPAGTATTRGVHTGWCSGIAADGPALNVALADRIVAVSLDELPLAVTVVAAIERVEPHDLVSDDDGLVYVSTERNGLARPGEGGPFWRPPFVTGDGDRCHLNGVAVNAGRVAVVTALSTTDEPGGWRTDRSGGCVVDVASGEVVVDGLEVPHSPRIADGRVWLAESGTGTVGFVSDDGYEPVAFLPGFTRGLALLPGHAVVGLSMPRRARSRLPLVDRLARTGTSPFCGFVVVDLERGEPVHWCRIDTAAGEIFGIEVVPRPTGLSPGGREGVPSHRRRSLSQTP
jgi:uncharacterized protein (TIGR03032 family)